MFRTVQILIFIILTLKAAAYFTVHNLNNAGISNKMIIQALIDAEYETGCDRNYLEKIEKL